MRRLLAAGLTCAALYAWPAAAAEVSGPAVEWLAAAGDGDIERAFAQAREQSKPVLLYWGAKWCPPCNQPRNGSWRYAGSVGGGVGKIAEPVIRAQM